MSAFAIPRNRAARLSLISQIISDRKIRSQRELAAILMEQGFEIAQPTLSRDLDDLAVGKDSAGFYNLQAQGETSESKLNRVLRDFLVSADLAGNLVVLKTPPGAAHLVAGAIDFARLSDVLGTVAGDDTVMVVVRNSQMGKDLLNTFVTLAELNT